MNEYYFSRLVKDLSIPVFHFAIVWLIFGDFFLLMTSCSTSRKVMNDHESRDSVVYIYKTHYRDSIRVKDSTVLIFETVRRDSVVMRVDKATGEVLSKDSWHWKDTNRDRDHISNVRNKVEKSDSAATKKDGRVVISKTEKTTNLPTKTHYTRTFFIGVCLGVLLSVAFRYRKKIFGLFAKMC